MTVLKKEDYIGTMRFDFADSLTRPCNSWRPVKDLTNDEIKEIQPKVNEIMFDRYDTFEKIKEKCKGTGYSNMTSFLEETDNFIYSIKLTPSICDYNYIQVFRK